MDITPGAILLGNDANEKYMLLSKINEADQKEIWIGYKFPSTAKQEPVHIHVQYKNPQDQYTSNGPALWPGAKAPDYSTYPKPPKTQWTRADLVNINSNKFINICDNHKSLEEAINKLQDVQVQRCLTPEMCPSCIEYIEGKTQTSEPVINIFEAIEGQSIREFCFGDGLTESQSMFFKECFKMIPILFKGYKSAIGVMKMTKHLHGSISLDSLWMQQIGRQRLWLTNLDDNWAGMDDDSRKFKDNADFVLVLFKLLFNDDGVNAVDNWKEMKKWYKVKMNEFELEKSSNMIKQGPALGTEDDGIFECFEFVDNQKVDLKLDCKQPENQKNTMVPPDI